MRRVATGLVALLACLLVASAALAAGPTGNPSAIAMYRHAVRVTNDLPAYVQSQTGYVRIQDSLGPTRVAHWAWGWDQFQPGYFPAAEHLVLAQRGGHTVWIDDTLTSAPAGCHSPRCRKAVPIEFLITKTRAYYGLISSGSTASCFVREALRDVPYGVGSPWWTPAGQFFKPKPDGARTQITSKFVVGHQLVTEDDWITRSTSVFAKSVLHVAAGAGHPGYSYRNTDTRLSTAPHFPKLTLCS